jgi:hypothetical protein
MKPRANVLAIAVACLLVLAAIFLAQDRLLYFPTKDSVERITACGSSSPSTPVTVLVYRLFRSTSGRRCCRGRVPP